jgi:RNA polymerase sigma-70 factor (ECF subfamily)
VDAQASEKMYEAYYMRVYSYVVTISGSRELAEEITQETFCRAMTKSASFRREADEVTWLCTIAKNLFYDEKRRQKKTGLIPEDIEADGKSIEQIAADRDSSFRVHLALHALEEPYREIFELRVFGELGFKDIGTIFGKTENWARVTYHRARLKLQERMKTDEN